MPARSAFVRVLACVALAAPLCLAAGAGPVRADAAGDTLTVIGSPLPNLPAFAVPGGVITVWADAAPSASGWRAALLSAWVTVPLAPAGGGHVPGRGRWELEWRVPDGTPEDTYDLVLESDVTPPDTSRHSVRVIPDFPESFYFAQISDTHLPTHMFSSYGSFSLADTSAQRDLNEVIADLGLIHPEFVLHTGDLVNEGELEEYLGAWQMARAQEMLYRFDAPVFVVPGNHDMSGWQDTPMPDGTARRAWWRRFGWPFLADPPPGDPRRTQDWTFDFAGLHVIGMETWQYTGGYDRYRPDLYGAQSLTAAQMAWLAADIATVPHGRARLLALHYDFGGTLPGGQPGAARTQLDPGALGLDGMIWGHWHGVPEASPAVPFDLGLQAVVDGQRTFRIFRVDGGVIRPGPMHHSEGAHVDSLTVNWSGPNDGSRARLTARVANLYNECWERGRLVFLMPDHDSSFTATGGVVVQTLRRDGRARVTVEFVLQPWNVMTVEVHAATPLAAWSGPADGLRLARPIPNPFAPVRGPLAVHVEVARPGLLRVRVHDLAGRTVATLHDGAVAAGIHTLLWDGRAGGERAGAGLYLVRAEAGGQTRVQRVALLP